MVFTRFNVAFAAAITLSMAFAQSAFAYTPVTLADIAHGDATITLVAPDGEVTVMTIDQIEDLPTYSLETTTPWRDTPAVFEGVMLRDLLAAGDLDDAASILVTAENDFRSTFPDQVWHDLPLLVATRVNGAPISRRERGPILFVIDDETYQKSSLAQESLLVWMAARIEVYE